MSAESIGRVVTQFLQDHPDVGAVLALLLLLHFILSGLHTLRLLGEWLLLTIKFLKHEIRAGTELGRRFFRELTTWEMEEPGVTGPRALVSPAQAEVAHGPLERKPPGASSTASRSP